jgi:hypothetical protein
MNRSQRIVISSAAYVVAAVLFVGYFFMPFWSWATWNKQEGTLDLGIVKFTNRPPFPRDARAIGLGLVIPIVLVAAGRIFVLGAREEAGGR